MSGETNRVNKNSTPAAVISFIHAKAEEKADTRVSKWECCYREQEFRPAYAAERQRWADAAYEGNWNKILEIIATESYDISRFANVTRLRPRIHDPAKGISGYTVLHQAAYSRAPDEIIKALIALGCFRQLRTLDGHAQRPCDIALARGFGHTAKLLAPPPDLIPHVSVANLAKVQAHFLELVVQESRGMFNPDEMRIVDLEVLREVKKVYMAVPGMYGGFNIHFEDDHLVTMSSCRVVGGSGRTNHITVDGATLVDSGW